MAVKRYLYTSTILLVLIFIAVCGITPSADAQKVHALLIIMDDNLDIRQTVDVNRLRIKKMLQLLDVSPEIWQADERQIRPEHINKWVKHCRVDLEDTIFVYYSGHGHIDQKARHYLDLDVQNPAFSLLRSDLVKELSEKRCRLKMLITDTCSNEIQTLPRATSSATVVSRKRPYAEDLFLKHRGLLDMTAASPRQYAWGNNQIGGYFTAALIESFTAKSDTNKDRFLSWKEVFSATRDGTQKLFEKTTFLPTDLLKMQPFGQKTQTPKIYSTLPKPDVVPRVSVPSEPSRDRRYSKETEALIFIFIVLSIIGFILFLLAKLVVKKIEKKRNSTPDETHLRNREKNLRKREKDLRLRNRKENLMRQEKNLNRKLSSGNLSQDQKTELKRQLKSNLRDQETVLKSFKRGNHIHRTRIRKLRRRIKGLG